MIDQKLISDLHYAVMYCDCCYLHKQIGGLIIHMSTACAHSDT